MKGNHRMSRFDLIQVILLVIFALSALTPVLATYQSLEFFHETFVNDGKHEKCDLNSTQPRFSVIGLKIPDLSALQQFTLGQSPVNIKDLRQLSTRGLWAGYSGVNYTMGKNEDFGWTFIRIPGPDCNLCWDLEENSCDLYIKSLRYLGNPDPSLPGLSLLTGDGDLNETWSLPYGEETYLDHTKTEWNFKERLCSRVWASTSPVEWTVYSGANFTGPSACLTPQKFYNGESYGYGNLNYSYVGSVRQGCYRNGSLTRVNFVDEQEPRDSFFYRLGPYGKFSAGPNPRAGDSMGEGDDGGDDWDWEDIEEWLNITRPIEEIQYLESCAHLWDISDPSPATTPSDGSATFNQGNLLLLPFLSVFFLVSFLRE